MHFPTGIFPSVLLAGLLAGSFLSSQSVLADDDHGAYWLSIPSLIEKLEPAGYRDIDEIEREHGRYEVRAHKQMGERSKLHVDASTGEIVVDNRSFKRWDSWEGRTLNSDLECKQRRCRDDIPAAPERSQ